jgi:hypothetical protein
MYFSHLDYKLTIIVITIEILIITNSGGEFLELPRSIYCSHMDRWIVNKYYLCSSDDSETHAYIYTHYSEIIVTRRGSEKLSPEYKSNM